MAPLECLRMQLKHGLRLILLLALPAALTGCQQPILSHSDNYMRSRVNRYWDGDSAEALRASRSRASESGFGFPIGMANQ